jgi:hypothetical protein
MGLDRACWSAAVGHQGSNVGKWLTLPQVLCHVFLRRSVAFTGIAVRAKTGPLEADIPTLEDHLRTYLQRPDVLEQLKALAEALRPFIDFFAMLG